uniref:ORF23 n=1 Tax=Nitrosopumilaceae spindle-shaped virus TaxID=3065433 RepID=A0AAT9JHR9_9VIRU
MGFSYNHLGLCCDFCSNAGPQKNVRKIACPYGWCQHWACCETCKKAKKHLQSSCTPEQKTHKEHCKILAIEYDRQQAAKIEVNA